MILNSSYKGMLSDLECSTFLKLLKSGDRNKNDFFIKVDVTNKWKKLGIQHVGYGQCDRLIADPATAKDLRFKKASLRRVSLHLLRTKQF